MKLMLGIQEKDVFNNTVISLKRIALSTPVLAFLQEAPY